MWDRNHKIWTSRKRGDVIGKIVATHPTEGEIYYLRLLLNHIRGATSFDDLKTFNNTNVVSFRESALLHG